jgi:hypothetical protein
LALGRHLHVVPALAPSEPAGGGGGLDLGGDYDIDDIDLPGRVGPICECGGNWT